LFKNLANLTNLLQQAQQMGPKLQEVQNELKQQRTTGAAGADMVQVDVNGMGEVLAVRIDPKLVEDGERDMIESLTAAAMNQANTKAKQMHMEAMKGRTEGLNIPGLEGIISKLGGQPEG